MKIASLSALVAAGLLAGGLAVTSANAADLGGNCCADLEERIAELEATTARKGNRKVSLTVSGWVAEQIVYWDDGVDSDTYIGGIGSTLSSHVKFTGQATISPGWTAGYVLQLEAIDSDALNINQDSPEGPSVNSAINGGATTGDVTVLQSYWFIKSDHLGKVGVGLQNQASNDTAILVDGSGSLIPANYVAFEYGAFGAQGSQTRWGDIFGCSDCNGYPTESVRYDSPSFGGFSFSASWGHDEFWDVAARYAGEHGGFKIAAAAAFSETSGDQDSVYVLQADDSEFFQVGAYAQHVATGLFVYGAYNNLDVDNGVENETWYIKAGIRQRWTPLGHTVLYGEYRSGENNNAAVTRAAGVDGDLFTADDVTTNASSEGDLWGIGAVQEIDSAAMSLWLSYRHVEGDIDGVANIEDFDYVKFGALINF